MQSQKNRDGLHYTRRDERLLEEIIAQAITEKGLIGEIFEGKY